MANYIERAHATDALINNTSLEGYDLEEAVNAICAIPSADVRHVVLCLHCKNWDTSWAPNCGKEYGHFCPILGAVTCANWFCADGEKREES